MFFIETPESEDEDPVLEIEEKPDEEEEEEEEEPTGPQPNAPGLKREAAEADNAPAAKAGRVDPEPIPRVVEVRPPPSPEPDLDSPEGSGDEMDFTIEEIEQLLATPENVIVDLWVTAEQMTKDTVEDVDENTEVTEEYKQNILPFSRKFHEEFRLARATDGRYVAEMNHVVCHIASEFADTMFQTRYGRMVLLVRPWENKLWNLCSSFHMCRISFQYDYDEQKSLMRLYVQDHYIAEATGSRKVAKVKVGQLAWDILARESITIITKEPAISYSQIFTVDDLINRPNEVFTMWFKNIPPANLGSDMDGIVEPIRPNIRVVIRKGMQCPDFTFNRFERAFIVLLEHYIVSETVDMDLFFNSDFTTEEWYMMCNTAQDLGLSSKRIVTDSYRYEKNKLNMTSSSEESVVTSTPPDLINAAQLLNNDLLPVKSKESSTLIRKRVDPFTIARRVIAKGGDTAKYKMYMPIGVRVELEKEK